MRYNDYDLLPINAFRKVGKRLATLEGSGGKAPKPDPQIGRAALETAAIGRDAFEFYKQEYINNKPNQDRLNVLAQEVQEQLIESGKLNNQYAKEEREYLTTVFRPIEKDIVKNANEYDTAGRREAEASRGLSDVRQAFDTQREMTMRSKERDGINPNSGNAQALGQQLDVQEAIAGANAVNKGRTDAEMRGQAMKIDAASLGRGLPSNQATSQQIANQSATAGLNAGLAGAQNQRAGLDIYGKGAGLAMQGVGKSAEILQNQYNGQMQAYQANQARNDGAWGSIGSLVGTGLSVFGGGLKDGGEVNPVLIDNETGEIFDDDGHVTGGGTETSDSIPAKLSVNEFVMNAGVKRMTKDDIIKAAKKTNSQLGLAVLESINKEGLKARKGNQYERTWCIWCFCRRCGWWV